MSTPPWWREFVGAGRVLADRDREAVAEWQDEPEADEYGVPAEVDENDVPPLTVRLGNLTQAFTEDPSAMSPQERRNALDVLERVQATGTQEDRTAVVTGFLEALLIAADQGFDLRVLWGDLGPESRSACLALNEFWGIESPGWMRAS